jgi:hypothetical protein
MKIRLVEAKLFHVDRQTERQADSGHDEAKSRFSQFYKLPLKKNKSVPTLKQAHVLSTRNISCVML